MKDEWDLLLGPDGDLALDGTGELLAAAGAALVAQDALERAKSRLGSLFYDRDYGCGVMDMLRGPIQPAQVVQALREAALADERIDWESISAGQFEAGRFYLRFQVLGAETEQTVQLGLEEVLDEL